METASKSEVRFLFASSIHVERKPGSIQTVLGSCISVCLYDQVLAFGGMNHYMLPFWKGDGLASPKYGNIAIERLIERMVILGANKKNIIAKIFGGAQQLDEANIYGIAESNIQIAEYLLANHKIPIVASNVGGRVGRKILYDTSTGMVYMKFVNQLTKAL